MIILAKLQNAISLWSYPLGELKKEASRRLFGGGQDIRNTRDDKGLNGLSAVARSRPCPRLVEIWRTRHPSNVY